MTEWLLLLVLVMALVNSTVAEVVEPVDNLLWNHICSKNEDLVQDCVVLRTAQWEGVLDQVYVQYKLNTQLGFSATDFDSCWESAHQIWHHGLELHGLHNLASSSRAIVPKVQCQWVRKVTIGEFFTRHNHPEGIVVQEVHQVDGIKVLQPPIN